MGEGVSPSLSRNGSPIAVSVLFSGEHGFFGGLNLQSGRQGVASSNARDFEITAVANDDPMVDTVSSDLQGTAPLVFVPGRSEHGSRPKESIYGVSLSLPRKGVPGDIHRASSSEGTAPFTREHGFCVGSVPCSGEHIYAGESILLDCRSANEAVSSFLCTKKHGDKCLGNLEVDSNTSVYVSSDPQGSVTLSTDPGRSERGVRPKRAILRYGGVSIQQILSVCASLADTVLAVEGKASGRRESAVIGASCYDRKFQDFSEAAPVQTSRMGEDVSWVPELELSELMGSDP